MNVMEQLNAVFCKVFNDTSIQLSFETTADDIEGWDSLMHFKLILAVEKNFGINFSAKELMVMKNVGNFVTLIEGKTTPLSTI